MAHVELRWILPEGTTTRMPILQYRNWGDWPAAAGPWASVPLVAVSSDEWAQASARATPTGSASQDNKESGC